MFTGWAAAGFARLHRRVDRNAGRPVKSCQGATRELQEQAFIWCGLADGRRIIEHVIIHHAKGKITRQVDVEAWD